MKLFHLSYDNGKMDAKEVARVLRDKLKVSEIGRPVESTAARGSEINDTV